MRPPPPPSDRRPGSEKSRSRLSSQQRAQIKARQKQARRQNQRPVNSVERLMRIERRKARSRVIFLSTVMLFIMLIMTLLIIAVMRKAKPSPQFLFIQNGSITHVAQGEALILRDDEVAAAPAAGTVKPLVTDGVRVSRGQKLALVIPPGLEDQLDNLNKCEQDLIDLQNELMNQGKGSGARAVCNESAVALTTIVNLVRADMATGTLSNLPNYAASMSVIMEQRSGKLATIDFHDARLNQLYQQKQSIEQALGLAAGTLQSAKPGIVSFHLDGLEEKLSTQAADTLTFTQFREALNQIQNRTTANQVVKAGEPVLRVTSSLEQDLALQLDSLTRTDLSPDRTYTIRAPAEGIEITNCRLMRTEAAENGTLAIFKTDRRVDWFADRRSFPAELSVSENNGYADPPAVPDPI